MKIIIVGCGKAGYEIARNLSAESKADITIIDIKQESLEKASESIDALLIRGSGLNSKTLSEAGAKDADLIISVTNADEQNILCCISARYLGTKHTIARVRNPEFALEHNSFWKDLGLDMIINPELETAREISRLLRFPTAEDIDLFVGGRVELVSFKVSDSEDYFAGKSVSQLFYKKKMNILLAMIERDDTPLIPHGELVFESQDIISVLGRPSDIMNYFSLIGKNTDKIKTAVIVGGGNISYYLMELLQRHSSGTKLKLIEIDKEKCEVFSENFPRCLVIRGDGTDEDILSSELDDRMSAIICMTNRDEENVIIALYSIRLGIKKVILKINHISKSMVKNLGLGSIISPKNITSDQIMRFVRGLTNAAGNSIKTMYRIFDSGEDNVEAVEINVVKKSRCLNNPLKSIRFKKGILIGCIIRNNDIIIPTGETSVQLGDTVIIIAHNDSILELDDTLDD